MSELYKELCIELCLIELYHYSFFAVTTPTDHAYFKKIDLKKELSECGRQ